MKRVLLIVLFSTLTVLVKSQGESCSTPNQQPGICRTLPDCTSLVNLYASDKSRTTINFLIASQKSCGNRAVGRNPILCCTDGVQVATTAPPPPPPPPTQAPQPSADSCTTPDGFAGYCSNIMECAPIIDQVKTRNQDPEFKQYIQKSNGACNYVTRAVCCPKDGPVGPPASDPTPKSTESSHLLTPEEGCGFSNVTHPKVVGGTPAKLGGWPWMALVGYRNDFGDVSFKCGGTLISTRHVLTAAHCVRKDLYSVRIGEHDLSSDSETQHVDIIVSKIITHPDYDKKDGHSDMAILVLEESVTTFGFTIRPICLPIDDASRTRNFEGTMPFVAGWGRTQEGGKSANVLQEVQLPVLKNTDCQTRYKKQNRLISAKQFDNAILCAGVLTGGMDSCQGDSGGPLMAPIRVGKSFLYYQIGVVSYGIGCARADVPGVYTRVSYFVDWIKEQVANN